MTELTVGHYQYHKMDASVRWFRKVQNLDGGTVDIRTGKRISTANNEIVILRAEVERLREDYRDLAWQSFPVREDGVVDSCAIPAYAYAMKQLGKTGDLIIDSDIGKRVMGHWVEDKP